jgi:hypothetical protein
MVPHLRKRSRSLQVLQWFKYLACAHVRPVATIILAGNPTVTIDLAAIRDLLAAGTGTAHAVIRGLPAADTGTARAVIHGLPATDTGTARAVIRDPLAVIITVAPIAILDLLDVVIALGVTLPPLDDMVGVMVSSLSPFLGILDLLLVITIGHALAPLQPVDALYLILHARLIITGLCLREVIVTTRLAFTGLIHQFLQCMKLVQCICHRLAAALFHLSHPLGLIAYTVLEAT